MTAQNLTKNIARWLIFAILLATPFASIATQAIQAKNINLTPGYEDLYPTLYPTEPTATSTLYPTEPTPFPTPIPPNPLYAGEENWITRFNDGKVNGYVDLFLEDNENIYLGGVFSRAGNYKTSNITQWNGQEWIPFNDDLMLDVSIYDIEVLHNGGEQLFVGGYYTNWLNGNHNLFYWNGKYWDVLSKEFNGLIFTLEAVGNKLYAGGDFSYIDNPNVNSIGYWDGSDWRPLNSGVSGDIYDIASDGTSLYVTGSFTIPGSSSIKNIARWNGTNWDDMGGGLNGYGDKLVIIGSDVYVHGGFTTAGSVTSDELAHWDGNQWKSMGTDLPDLSDIATDGTDLYVLGDFEQIGGENLSKFAVWNGSNWISPNFDMSQVFNASSIGSGQGKIYFSWYDINFTNYIYQFDRAEGTWAEIKEVDTDPKSYIHSLTASDSHLFAAGDFSHIGEVPAMGIAAWDGLGWQALGNGIDQNNDNYLLDILYDNGRLYAGGHFTQIGDISANHLAYWENDSWQDMGGGVSYAGDWPEIYKIASQGENLYICGFFNQAGSTSAANIAYWDGTTWQTVGDGLPGVCYDLAWYKGDLYAGGNWPGGIKYWNGSTWQDVTSGLNGPVYTLASSNEYLYAGGDFSTAGEINAINIARWNGSQWSALGQGLGDESGKSQNTEVFTLLVDNNLLYAGGSFIKTGYDERFFIASWDGTKWSRMGWGTNGSVFDMTMFGNQLFIGGDFSMVGSYPSMYLAGWLQNPLKVFLPMIKR